MSSEPYRQSNPCIFLFKILYNRLYYIASFSASGIATAVVCFSNCTLLHIETDMWDQLQPIKRSKGYYKGPPDLCSSISGSVFFSSRLLMQAWHARMPDMYACEQCRMPCSNCMHRAVSSACSMHTGYACVFWNSCCMYVFLYVFIIHLFFCLIVIVVLHNYYEITI